MTRKELIPYAAAVLLTVALVLNAYRNRALTDQLERTGVLVRATITGKDYFKGTHIWQVRFRFQNREYRNQCQTEKNSHELGDTVTLKIIPQAPDSYCVIEEEEK